MVRWVQTQVARLSVDVSPSVQPSFDQTWFNESHDTHCVKIIFPGDDGCTTGTGTCIENGLLEGA